MGVMMKINKHIEIVRSSKSGLSSLSQESSDAIFSVLNKNYGKVGVTIVDDLAGLEALVSKQPDLVFLGMKFIPNGADRIWLTTFLDQHGIAYTGSAQAAHSQEYDKATAKQCIIDAGLETAPFSVAKQDAQSTIDKIDLDYPLFVKPLNGGGGSGIDGASVVYNHMQLRSKVRAIAVSLRADSLIEQYLPGREFSVAILKNESGTVFSVMPLELIAPITNGVQLLSRDVKSANAEKSVAVTDLAIKSQIEKLALDAFNALGARDYGRIDIRLDKYGRPNFLEANLIPSLIAGYGSFPKACVINIGLGYEPMILRIVRLSLIRGLNLKGVAKPPVAIPALGSLEPAIATI